MDPQSQSFTPYSNNEETWKLHIDVGRLAHVQAEHAERIARLERRQEDDARLKSVWGQNSPFPSVLSGTPQQAPLQQPPGDHFRSFDDDGNNLMSSLHLDAEEEPRRGMGATSRANSVRFDETANQNHFSHSSRPSVDLLTRSNSGLSGFAMGERTSSHKSEGRASSVHSMRSAASGRAISLNLDSTAYGLGDSNRSPFGTPGLAPGLMLLGSVPAIIRCWMNTNFKHDALLYAAVCTGSYKSFLDLSLIHKLGFESEIKLHEDGSRSLELPVYFPEAVPHPASSRSSSPAPQLPTLTVDFQVAEHASTEDDKAIQIFLGSDMLRAHSADVLFSSNSMTILDDDRSKLSIPLVRPENEAAFNSLYITSSTAQPGRGKASTRPHEQHFVNGLGQGSSSMSISSAPASPPPGRYRPPGVVGAIGPPSESVKAGATVSDTEPRPASGQSSGSRPSLNLSRPADPHDQPPDSTATAQANTPDRATGPSAIWSNWRRDGPSSATSATTSSSPQTSNGLDWASAGKNRDASYQRKDTGIKVLKPKTASRNFSSATAPGAPATTASSPAEGKSKFFDEGKRRSSSGPQQIHDGRKENITPASGTAVGSLGGGVPGAAQAQSTIKTKSNPIGGGSAFSWMNK